MQCQYSVAVLRKPITLWKVYWKKVTPIQWKKENSKEAHVQKIKKKVKKVKPGKEN